MNARNKWLMALAGMSIQLSIGSIYAYSVWVKPLVGLNQWDPHDLKTAFSLAICFLGLTAAFLGKFVQKIGPVKAGLLGAFFFSAGLAGAGLAASLDSMPLFYLFYGVVSGVGLGLGYITPVSVVVKWFPERPGFASGLVIMSFAAGSILASQIISPLIEHTGVEQAFYLLAAGYAVLMGIASLYLQVPPAGPGSGAADYHGGGGASVRVSDLLRDVRFYGLWLMLFFNTTCGIALIAVAAPMAKDILHISDAAAIAFVGSIGLFNGIGRLLWSSVSDKVGRWATYLSFFLLGSVCFALLAQTTSVILFQGLVFVIISCYGGAFATMPAFLKDLYGEHKMGGVFGYVLTAWAAAAFAGPWLISLSTAYGTVFYVFSGVLAATAALTFSLKGRLVKKNSPRPLQIPQNA